MNSRKYNRRIKRTTRKSKTDKFLSKRRNFSSYHCRNNKKTTYSEIPNIIYDIVEIISIFYIINRLHFVKLISTELEKTSAPLLTLHKKKKKKKNFFLFYT